MPSSFPPTQILDFSRCFSLAKCWIDEASKTSVAESHVSSVCCVQSGSCRRTDPDQIQVTLHTLGIQITRHTKVHIQTGVCATQIADRAPAAVDDCMAAHGRAPETELLETRSANRGADSTSRTEPCIGGARVCILNCAKSAGHIWPCTRPANHK